ncbi:hypothetical protein [Nocardia puris]|uniref:Uncharacterized protein n=1 Tax=Nocardia puris TaxID=208602 RepID=A0A366CXR7_9NOCA|nr:hypothetical protein [Nocardia puris]RBO82054.1 hypothetical protein DFR74_1259 [Nocardia puris]
MTLWSRGEAPAFIRLGEQSVLRMHLGEELVYDGTRPVVLVALPGVLEALAPVSTLRAGLALTLPPGVAATDAPASTVGAGVAASLGAAAVEAVAPTASLSAGTALELTPGGAEALAPRGSFGGVALELTPGVLDVRAPVGAMGAGFAREMPLGAVEAVAPTASLSAGVAFELAPGQAEAIAPIGSVETPTFDPSGMNKSGTQSVTTSYAQVNNWTADTANYPGSTVSGHALVAQGSKADATVAASVVIANSNFSNFTATLRLYRNGDLLQQGSPVTVPATKSATVTVTATPVAVTSGDLITLQVIGSGTPMTLQAGGWVRIT